MTDTTTDQQSVAEFFEKDVSELTDEELNILIAQHAARQVAAKAGKITKRRLVARAITVTPKAKTDTQKLIDKALGARKLEDLL